MTRSNSQLSSVLLSSLLARRHTLHRTPTSRLLWTTAVARLSSAVTSSRELRSRTTYTTPPSPAVRLAGHDPLLAAGRHDAGHVLPRPAGRLPRRPPGQRFLHSFSLLSRTFRCPCFRCGCLFVATSHGVSVVRRSTCSQQAPASEPAHLQCGSLLLTVGSPVFQGNFRAETGGPAHAAGVGAPLLCAGGLLAAARGGRAVGRQITLLPAAALGRSLGLWFWPGGNGDDV